MKRTDHCWRVRIWGLGLALAAAMAFGPVAAAEDVAVESPVAADKKSGDLVELNGDSIEYKADQAKFLVSGNVVLKRGTTVLFADKAEFFRDRKEAEVEGNVVLESEQGTIWADKAFYNFENKRGEFTNARIMSYPMFGQASSITRVGDNYYVFSNGWLSTSDYDDPEYRIRSRKIEFYPGNKAVAHNSTMYLGTLPVMYLPWYTQDLRENRPHFSVIPGYKKDFGGFLLTAYRFYPAKYLETILHMDYRERKDLAWGVDFKYNPPGWGQGLLRTYYMNERNVQSDRIWDERLQPTTERERYRVEWRHLWNIDPQTQFIAQYYKLSDSEFLKKYFEQEYRDDESPDTYAVLTRAFDKATATLRVDARVNRFESTVQRLPEANVTFSNQPVADTGFYVKSSNTVSFLTKEDAVPSDNQNRTWRADTDNEISRPFKLAFVELRPYAGTEQTYYQRSLGRDEDDAVRGIFRAGIDSSTKFYRVYDTQFKRYGVEVNKLRHVVTPTVGYLYQPYPTVMSGDLFQYDTIDARTKIDKFSIGIANTLQTKREGKVHDIFRSLFSTEYKLHDDPTDGDEFGNFKIENEFYPNQYVTLHQDAEYATDDGHLQTLNLELYLRDDERWDFAIGRRYTFEDDDLLTTELAYKFNSKWRTVLYDRWNIDTGVWQEQRYAFVRDLHSWEVEFAFNDKKGYEDSGNEVWIIFRIKAFPTVMVGGGSSYNKREVSGNE